MPKFLIIISAVLFFVPDATTSENAHGHPKRLSQGTSQFQPNLSPITTDPPLPSPPVTPEAPAAPMSSMPTRSSHINPSNPVSNNQSQLPVSVPSFPSSAKPNQKPELGPSVPSSSPVSPTMIKPISLEPVAKPVSSRPVTLPPSSPIQPVMAPALHPTMPQPIVVPPSSTSHQPITPPALHPTMPQPILVPPSSSSHQPIMPITNKPVISPAPHPTTPSNGGGDHGTPFLKGFTVFFFISLLVYGAYLGYVNRSTLLFIIGRMCADFTFKIRRFIGQVKMRLRTLRRNAERPPSLNEILFDDSTQAELSTRLLPNDDSSQ